MLVGDHGRVIPFRHFKALTIGVGVVLFSSLGALILLGIMHLNLRQQISVLQQSLDETRVQTTKFRDEKDLYLTQLIALKKQTGELPQNSSEENVPLKESAQLEPTALEPPKPEEIRREPEPIKAEAPVQKAEPQIQWSADIRDFKVAYDNQQQILKAEFRIYNTSRPKKTLTGRTVVVFKALADPPIQWATVPAVPLRDGKPVGNNGKSFRVNNYRTENFKTLRGKYSAEYDTASVYIFTEHGELIANQELSFNVDYSPPAPVKPAPPPSVPEPEKITAPPVIRQGDQSVPAGERPAPSVAPTPSDSEAVTQQPNAAPAAVPDPIAVPENKAPEPQGALDDKTISEPAKNESTSQIPAAETQPAPKGGPK